MLARTVPILTLLCCLPATVKAELRVATSPNPLVLDKKTELLSIQIFDLPGSGPIRTSVNIGRVTRVETQPEGVTIHYQPPEERFPQQLCLMLWRAREPNPKIHVVRLDMLGRTVVPIRTRPNSSITISVGRLLFGPHKTGRKGRRRVRLVVPPHVTHALVRVTDRYGLRTFKKIRISTRPFKQLAVASIPLPSRGHKKRYRIAVASVSPKSQQVMLAAGDQPLALSPQKPGLWLATWSPKRPGETVVFKAWQAGSQQNTSQLTLASSSPKAAVVIKKRPLAPRPLQKSKNINATIAVGLGLLHNTGELFSPRVTIAVGGELRLPVGWLGAFAQISVSWADQQLAGPQTVGNVESKILLLPFGLGMTYHLPWSVVTPYISSSFLAQMIYTKTSASAPDGYDSVDWTFAWLGQLGAERKLGPGLIYLQSGFQWSRIENQEIQLLAGGVIVETGYRLRL